MSRCFSLFAPLQTFEPVRSRQDTQSKRIGPMALSITKALQRKASERQGSRWQNPCFLKVTHGSFKRIKHQPSWIVYKVTWTWHSTHISHQSSIQWLCRHLLDQLRWRFRPGIGRLSSAICGVGLGEHRTSKCSVLGHKNDMKDVQKPRFWAPCFLMFSIHTKWLTTYSWSSPTGKYWYLFVAMPKSQEGYSGKFSTFTFWLVLVPWIKKHITLPETTIAPENREGGHLGHKFWVTWG